MPLRCLSKELFDRLHQLPSRPDWQNEIHLTTAGYEKLSARWAVVMNAVL